MPKYLKFISLEWAIKHFANLLKKKEEKEGERDQLMVIHSYRQQIINLPDLHKQHFLQGNN